MVRRILRADSDERLADRPAQDELAVDAVLFDLDGTLVDSLPGIVWSIGEALAACGLPPKSSERILQKRRSLRPSAPVCPARRAQ